MNTIFFVIFIIGIACILLPTLLLLINKPNQEKNSLSFQQSKLIVFLGIILILPYIVIVVL